MQKLDIDETLYRELAVRAAEKDMKFSDYVSFLVPSNEKIQQ